MGCLINKYCKHFWCSAILVISLTTLMNAGCKKSGTGFDLHSEMPEITVGHVYWKDDHTAADEKILVDDISGKIRTLLSMLDKKDLSGLPAMVSPEQGLYTDLKVHKKYDELSTEIQKKDGYLRTFFLDTETLRTYSKDPRNLAVRDVFLLTERIKVDFYVEQGSNQCELKIFLLDSPENNYRLNNPVFVRDGLSWKLLRLF